MTVSCSIGSSCSPLAAVNCLYHDTSVRCSLPGYLWDPSRFFDSFSRDLKTFLLLCDYVLYKYTVDIDICRLFAVWLLLQLRIWPRKIASQSGMKSATRSRRCCKVIMNCRLLWCHLMLPQLSALNSNGPTSYLLFLCTPAVNVWVVYRIFNLLNI